MKRPKYTEQEYNEWVNELVDLADGQIMTFSDNDNDNTPWCLTGGGNFYDYLSDEEYENIKRIFNEREIEYEYD